MNVCMVIKKLLFLVFMALLCLNLVFAVDFTVSAVPISNNINIDERASFNFSITNNLNSDENFRIYSLSYPEWDIQTDPISNPIMIIVPAMSTASLKLFVDPLHITSIGLYILDVHAKMTRTG